MKALTIRQPWASLIIGSMKSVEWRSWAAPQWLVGQRFVIHAGGKSPRTEVRELRAMPARSIDECCGIMGIAPEVREAISRPFLRGVGLGTARLVGCEDPTTIFRRVGWEARFVHYGNVGWILADIDVWAQPVPCPGRLGLWDWPEAA